MRNGRQIDIIHTINNITEGEAMKEDILRGVLGRVIKVASGVAAALLLLWLWRTPMGEYPFVSIAIAVGVLAAVVWTAYQLIVMPAVATFRWCREGRWKGPLFAWVVVLCVMAVFAWMNRWYRAPEWDQHSPDGRYTILAYGDRYFFSMTPGDGSSRKAKIKLVENSSGKVLGVGYVDRLWAVSETFWSSNRVEVTRGDGMVEFELTRK